MGYYPLGRKGPGACTDCGAHSDGLWPGRRCPNCWNAFLVQRRVRMFAEQTVLYRLYDEHGQLLYVGVTGDPRARWKEHRTKMPWWPEVAWRHLELYDTGVEARHAEARAIWDEQPLYNRTAGKDADGKWVDVPLPGGCPDPPGYAWSPPRAEYWPAWFVWRAVFRDCMLNPEERATLGRLGPGASSRATVRP